MIFADLKPGNWFKTLNSYDNARYFKIQPIEGWMSNRWIAVDEDGSPCDDFDIPEDTVIEEVAWRDL